jgi:ParB-like chromosome segregation protein Spo0J
MKRPKIKAPRNAIIQKADGATTSVAVTNIPLKLIVVFTDERRPIVPDAADRLAKSIDLEGLKIPIDLVLIEEGILKGKYRLITGAHRLEAFRILGKDTIS